MKYLVSLVALLCACSSTPTQTVVIFSADASSATRATQLKIEVSASDGSTLRCAEGESCNFEIDLATNSFPIRMPLIPKDNDASRRFTVTGTLSDDVGAFSTVRVQSGYTADSKREIVLNFESSCEDVTCDAPNTCSSGTCKAACDPDFDCGDAGVPDAGVDVGLDADAALEDADPQDDAEAGVMMDAEAGVDADASPMMDADAALMDADANVPDMPVVPMRVTDGLVALYTFDEGSGTTVVDQVGDNDLAISGATEWVSGALKFNAGGGLAIGSATTSITTACQASNELTVESWVTPDQANYEGPARVVSFSETSSLRNFTLMFGTYMSNSDNLAFRLRSGTPINENGTPETTRPNAITANQIKQFVTRNGGGQDQMYIDGAVFGASEARVSDYAGWDDTYSICIGNECSNDRPFTGTIHLVAIYCKALSAAEIQQNYDAGR